MSQSSLRWFLLGAACILLSIPGCGGCRNTDTSSDNSPSEKSDAVVIISEPQPLPFGNEVNRMLVKPGHVAEAQQEFKTGPIDINGRIEGQTFSKSGAPLPVPGSRWSLNFARDAALPNRQTKRFDLRFFISPSYERDESSTFPVNPDLRTVLIDRNTGTPVVSPRPTPTTPIPGHQYFFVVLSEHRDDYEYLSKSDLVSWQALEVWDGEVQAAYQFVLCNRANDRWMLPSTFFGWTTTAFLIWDDVDPETLSSSQKQALIDWLHWGGQLIVSGPSSISRLSGSFLEPYLPLQNCATVAFDQSNLDFLNSNWALREPKASRLTPRATLLPESTETTSTNNTPGVVIPQPTANELDQSKLEPLIPTSKDQVDNLGPLPERVIPKLQGELMPASKWLENTGNLVAQKTVGRGRVVLSTLSLSEPLFARWRSFPSFINATMLGRPPRGWQENNFNSRQTWMYRPNQETDSRVATRFRIFSRDGLASNIDEQILFEPAAEKAQQDLSWKDIEKTGSVISGWDGDPINGIGAWNSSSSTSNAAKDLLRNAAGINVPKVGTIVLLLLAYLACLVPLNWFIFYILGKVEWAWAAVPVISIGGVITVAYIAQLDIGFARSYTEVAVVEAFADHPRAHVTRYSAIYSSLSTPYRLTLNSDSGVTVPMISREREFASSLVETVRFDYGSADGNFLYPLNILSNSTTFLHTEQMVDLGGTFQFKFEDESKTKFSLANQTQYSWDVVAAVRRNSDGLLEAAWINQLPANSSSTTEFNTADLTKLANFWNWRRGSNQDETDFATNDVSKFSVMVRAISGLSFMRAGEIRVLAFAPNSIEGFDVQPAAGSILENTVLLLHVRCGEYPTPEPDRSLPSRQMSSEAQKRELEGSDDSTIDAEVNSEIESDTQIP
jgi:hypothetical protein